jgi:hypothetical protein
MTRTLELGASGEVEPDRLKRWPLVAKTSVLTQTKELSAPGSERTGGLSDTETDRGSIQTE